MSPGRERETRGRAVPAIEFAVDDAGIKINAKRQLEIRD